MNRTRTFCSIAACLVGLPFSRGADAAAELPSDSQAASSPESKFHEEIDDLSLSELMDLVLDSGSFLELDLYRSPMSITVINRKKIRDSGARHLSELLEIYVPGFQYSINKWNGVIWGMRGTSTDRNSKILFLVNGVSQNLQASHGAYTELVLGLLDDIDRVEVLRGPAGMVYGSGSISGVVNVVTRKPEESTVGLRGGAGSQLDAEAQALVHHQFNDDLSLTLSGGVRRADGQGLRSARIYGNHAWPEPSSSDPADPSSGVLDGNPSDGSPGNNPLSLRASADLHWKGFRFYGRYTHQSMPTGQYYIVDPWPGYVGPPPASAGSRVIDGRVIEPDDALADADSFGANRRLHITDNIIADASYTHDIGPDQIHLGFSWVGNTDRTVIQDRPGYDVPGNQPSAGDTVFTFGEKRYTTRFRYLIQRLESFKLVVGGEWRIDDIGKDLRGRNEFGGSKEHFFVKDVVYHNLGLYSEFMWTPRPNLVFDGGLRVDKHTRTPWILNPRASAMWLPTDQHAVKLIFQTSSNNGQADFYELDWTSVDPDGNIREVPVLENPRDPNSRVLWKADPEGRRSLQPERAYSLELASVHNLFRGFTLSPSLSWTTLTNIFAWNADLFRTVNAGSYSFIAAEVAANYDASDRLDFGINHSYQRVVSADLEGRTLSRSGTDVIDNGDGTFSLVENPEESEEFQVQAVRDQITQDGKTFLNLSSHATKAYISFTPIKWLRLHSDIRMFWGLSGRRPLWEDDLAQGYNYLGLENDSSVMVKWNASVHLLPGPKTRISFYAYDLLGQAHNRHAVRFQQSAANYQRALYTVDLRSFFVSLEHQF